MSIRIVAIVLALSVWAGQGEMVAAQREDILDANLVVRFLDAGDGEAVWMTTPNVDPQRRATVVINCGPVGFGGRLALQLQTAKVTQIDTLILGGSSDELIGGCADVVQQVPIREIRWTGQRGSTPIWLALETLLQAQGWNLIRVAAQDFMFWGDIHAVVLNPARAADLGPDPDDSLVVQINYARWGIVYAGDIHARGETFVQRSLETSPSAVQVLKVADHGSAEGTSLEFLKSVFATSSPLMPRTAVVTNGTTAFSKRIDDRVRTDLSAVGVEAVNTADHGTVTVVVHPDFGSRYVAER
jgi:beta-lactamase superfamily II metal-dependent hydrolase